MKTFNKIAPMPGFVAVLTLACSAAAYAQTQEASLLLPATTPSAMFQYSTLVGLGDTIWAGRVPVVTSSGTTYNDVTLQFSVDSSGNLTLVSTQIAPSATLITSGFEAGEFRGPSNVFSGNAIISVSGPGVTKGGATEWSLAAATGANECTYPSSATWYVGPLASNPLYSRLSKAGIVSTNGNNWSYGFTGGEACYNAWPDNALIGLSQTGNALTIASFTDQNGDHNEPVAQITYTYVSQ